MTHRILGLWAKHQSAEEHISREQEAVGKAGLGLSAVQYGRKNFFTAQVICDMIYRVQIIDSIVPLSAGRRAGGLCRHFAGMARNADIGAAGIGKDGVECVERRDFMKCVVLLSGGVDSTTCLAMAVEAYGKGEVMALTAYYGQKHAKEIEAARAVAAYYGVIHREADLAQAFALSDCSLLQNSPKAIRHASYAQQLAELGGEGTLETYVPFRNGLFLSYAAAAAVSVGAEVIYYGAHQDDAAGRAYPDCTPEFEEAMAAAIYEGSGRTCRLEAPLLHWNKAGVVREGLRLGAPYELTWSCYEGGSEPCGACGTCIDRERAFAANGVADPARQRRTVMKP